MQYHHCSVHFVSFHLCSSTFYFIAHQLCHRLLHVIGLICCLYCGHSYADQSLHHHFQEHICVLLNHLARLHL